MKHYFKIFLLSVGIGFFNILMYTVFLQIQIVPSNLYFPQEIIGFGLILLSIPIQFALLSLISFLFKKNKLALLIASGFFIVSCFLILWFTSVDERRSYNQEAKQRQRYSKTEQRDYNTRISTPEGYPIKLLTDGGDLSVIIDGQGYRAGQFETDVFSETWGNGWGNGTGSSVPDSLKILWFSFVENKYYGLNAKLDKTKISNYFKNGYKKVELNDAQESTLAKQGDYKDLIAGIAPGGDVVVWLSGRKDTREIGVFKGKELNSDQFKEYDIVKEDEIKKVLRDTCTCKDNTQFRKIVHNKKPIPFGTWTTKYREKLNWKVDINSLEPTKSELELYFYNGENFSLFNEEVTKSRHQNQAVPSYIIFHFLKNKQEYKAFFQFDEDEIFSNFKTLTKENRDELLDIVLNFNENFTTATVKIKSKNKTLDFAKMKTLQIRKIKNS